MMMTIPFAANKNTLTRLMVIGLVILKSTISFSQAPPVFVPVQNITQQNPAWCWAAVTEQILMWQKHSSPKQCDIVAQFAKELKDNCCENPSICNSPGSLNQIQVAFNKLGVKYSGLLPPPNYQSLYDVISSNHAIILAVQSSRIVGHCIVIVGISEDGVIINDPTGVYGQSLPLATIQSLWSAAIAI